MRTDGCNKVEVVRDRGDVDRRREQFRNRKTIPHVRLQKMEAGRKMGLSRSLSCVAALSLQHANAVNSVKGDLYAQQLPRCSQ